ncbi:MAG: hypothetical protein RR704_10360 [Stenotrophomonas sp.]
MNRDEPLTSEERELAKLLGRRAEQGPPAALDAAILAAARAAVDAPVHEAPVVPGTPRALRGRRRWPAVFGIAASMVFAVGIAWQMRPEPPPVPAEAQIAAMPAGGMAADAGSGSMAHDSAAADVAVAETAPTSAPASVVAKQVPAPAIAAAPAPPPVMPAPMMAPAPMEATAPPPAATSDAAAADIAAPRVAAAAPPALDAYAAPAPAAAAEAAPAAMRARKAEAATAGVTEAQQNTTEDRVALTGSRQEPIARGAPGVMRRAANAGLSAEAVQAEVQHDAGLPRRQWLQKIRERRDAGQRDLARASLERYLQQYPETRLPKDLRPLLDD